MKILETIRLGDFEATRKLFKRAVDAELQEESISQYEVSKHDVFDETKRAKKFITKDSGETDSNGNPILIKNYPVEVNRVASSLQSIIVERRVGFTLTNPVKTEAVYSKESEKEKELFRLIEDILQDNKMDYKNKEVLRRVLTELECAVLWYFVGSTQPGQPKYTLKCKILSKQLGDSLYPLFDETGSMVSFAREYKLSEGENKVEHFDIFTDEAEYKYVNRDSKWVLDELIDSEGKGIPNPIPNQAQKMMIEYYQIDEPIWAKVQSKISRVETLESNHADMNDYFGSPMMAVSGQIQGYAQKGEQGKIIQLAQGAEAKYLALSTPPESIISERENLLNSIYSESQTPNISFSEMKGLGNIAEITMRSFFIDAHMAVACLEEWFGIGLQRRLNILKTAIGKVINTGLEAEANTLRLKPIITPYLPINLTEKIENLTVAKTGGIISTETAIELNPLIQNKEVEMERMGADENKVMAGQLT